MRSLIYTFILTFSLLSKAAGEDSNWLGVSDGQHSFKNLGSSYYVEVPVKKVEGARLVLFNRKAAKSLGLTLPQNSEELEKLILDQFAFFVDSEGNGDKSWFATKYQDSDGQGVGEARGDGRALWSGEMVRQHGDESYGIDFVLKGIGQTPLAWTNHASKSHKDGLQSMSEAVHSFIMSEVNLRNQMNSTIDLAVIEIPILKEDGAAKEKAAITLRIGDQTRIAHLRFWQSNPDRFKRIFDYVVRRALRRPLPENLIPQDYSNYMHRLAAHLANEAARYYDLHAVHGSPTPGNRTGSGATIDLGTFRYLDAHHANYNYLFRKRQLGGSFGQVEQMKSYLNQVHSYAKIAKIDLPLESARAQFDLIFKKRLIILWLNRMGIQEDLQHRVPKQTKIEIYEFFKQTYELQASEFYKFADRNMQPALYDVRQIFQGLPLVLAEAPEKRFQVAKDLFVSKREWAGSLNWIGVSKRVQRFVDLLGEIEKVIPDLAVLSRTHGSEVNRITRAELAIDKRSAQEPILEDIRTRHASFDELTAKALSLADSLIDEKIPVNEVTHLGRNKELTWPFRPRTPVYLKSSCGKVFVN